MSVAEWDDEHEFDQSYLAAVQQEGSAGTQVFGMRLMWDSLDDLSIRLASFFPGMPSDRARFQSAFGPSVYVHLSREDKISQAVSRLKAEQSGLWHVAADGTERERLKPGQPPVFDTQCLSDHVAESEDHEAAWASWFTRQNIQPVKITYEALSSEPQITLATVLSALGLDSTIAETVEPRTAKMADSESREWATRFRTERPRPSV